MLKAIIFDFDGVLHNTYEKNYQLNKKAIKDLTREEHKQMFEGNVHKKNEEMKHRHTGYVLVEDFSEYLNNIQSNEENKKILKKLSSKYLLGVISSTPSSGLNTYFENNGLSSFFSFVYGADVHKSKVVKFKMFFEKYNIKPEECVFITDTVGDILEGRSVGVKSIAVDFGYHERERLEKAKPFKIASSLLEVKQIIDEI